MHHSALCEELKLANPPLAVWRTNDSAISAITSRGCSLQLLKQAMSGEGLMLTQESFGCIGAKNGFGFVDGIPDTRGGFGKFLTVGKGKGYPAGERIKCSEELAEAMILSQPAKVMEGYKALSIERFNDQEEAELVIFLANPDQLAALVHLFNYRKSDYDTVIMPMSSGCASIFRIPLGELVHGRGRAVVGNVDVFSRPHFPKDAYFFIVSAGDYRNMLEDAGESFLIAPIWNGVKKRL